MRDEKGYFEYAKYGSIGISWVLSTSIYFYLGYKGGAYLDARFGTTPIFLVVGLLAGMGLSIKTLIGTILAVLDGSRPGERYGSDREKSNKSPKEPE